MDVSEEFILYFCMQKENLNMKITDWIEKMFTIILIYNF